MQDIDKNFFQSSQSIIWTKTKTLLNSLGSQPWLRGGKDIYARLWLLGKNENIRAEELSIEDFADLVREIRTVPVFLEKVI